MTLRSITLFDEHQTAGNVIATHRVFRDVRPQNKPAGTVVILLFPKSLQQHIMVRVLYALDIPPKAQERVFKLAIRAIYISFSTLVEIRQGCFRAMKQSS